eukprot:TRINITY_DN6997_c0_g1_i1.p1 TRINITY_DN6997_c0_g1~~TRINITY_DN6997_c0_g1_i1.p1  ORF type:complete len:597 (-),score=136.12 TRINITY_DN6997_c0_g1_i1:303-2093(-)
MEDNNDDMFIPIDTDSEVTTNSEKPKRGGQAPRSDKLLQQKNNKKLTRAREVIAQKENKSIQELFTTTPRKYMYLANVGPGSGIKQEQIEEMFNKFDGFERVFAEKNKNYIMLRFATPKNAEVAYNALHGTHSEEFNRPLFLFFAKTTPPNEGLTWEDIPGLVMIENFINEDEEKELVSQIESSPGEWQSLKKRSVKHWGYSYNYKEFSFDKTPIGPLPDFSTPYLQRIKDLNKIEHSPDQMTVNIYEPGAGIPSHVETHSAFEDGVVSLSLMSTTIMEFKHPDGDHVELVLPPRSLLILTKQARYCWSHGINPRKTDVIDNKLVDREKRISLTFRKVRTGECDCPYKAQCDSWLTTYKGPTTHNTKIEDAYVKNIYDTIAEHFSDTRYKPWPKIKSFLEESPVGSLVCDVGCGNGKYLGVAPNVYKIGNDQSIKLIEIARERGHEVSACNNLHLPFRSEIFDIVLSIAVIHHFSTELHRIKALEELTRILRPGGRMLVYVWAMEQEQRKFGQQDVLVPWHLDKEKYQNDSEVQQQPSEEGGPEVLKVEKTFVVYQRYYHVFRKGELTELIRKIPNLKVVSEDFDHANWVVCAEKL